MNLPDPADESIGPVERLASDERDRPDAADVVEEGGDPACWLDLIEDQRDRPQPPR